MKKPENPFTCKVRETLLRAELIPGLVKPEAFRVGERLFCSLYSAGLYASEMKLEVEPLYSAPDPSVYTAERESHITDYMQDQINYYAKQLLALTVPQGWVVCSERMPSNHTAVITWDGMYQRVQFTTFGHWQCWNPERITHWHPLPSPPTTEK